MMNLNDIYTILPPLVLAGGAIVLLLVDLIVPRDNKAITAWLAIVVFAASLATAPLLAGRNQTGFNNMTAVDDYALFLDGLFACIGIVTVLLTLRYNQERGIMRGEFYPLLLFSTSGMMLMAHAVNLLTVFVGVELLSIPLYILCGIARPRVDSEESAMKYFLLGAFASGFLVYGIALIYGATGTTQLSEIARKISVHEVSDNLLLYTGAGLILVGLGFKVAAAPFHMWTPDVYEGAPTTVTAFMATATKAAGFAALIRVFMFGLAPLLSTWQPIMAVISALTMIVGNVIALSQTNLKRMLAYSSIAHAGYILMGVAAGNAMGATGVLFYLASYAVTTLAAFAVMTSLGTVSGEDQSIEGYAGLFRRKPFMAIVMALAMFSLTGVPPTAGFAGKYFLFQAAISSNLVWLAVIGVLTSVISAYFYLRVVVTMFMREPAEQPQPLSVSNFGRSAAVVITGAATLAIGILPSSLLGLVTEAVKAFASAGHPPI
ncbi:MAG: NADH-quinone oxidoreductase subunit N [Chloroflexi bacterium]|nr:NADH-quinone oxidoreductase subunit N [Chloroflexota bacterium]MCL5275835.1 NADH-quinone oxidoreductase subunit N [Chloroflexota bacterium]